MATRPFPETRPRRHGVVTSPDSVTEAVLKAMSRAPDPRLRQVMANLVRHLHAFLKETRPTEEEFERGLDFIRRLGQASGEKKNEVILASDLLGLSSLVVLLNNPSGEGLTDAALLGPFWRARAPLCKAGDSIARHGDGGEPFTVSGRVTDIHGKPLAGAEVDVWQASPVGLYENQDEGQPDMNLRGRFVTDGEGRYALRSVLPAGYPVPTDGPCGELLAAQVRHPYRPAHVHFMVSLDGYRTLITQVFADEEENMESDVVFGVTPGLSGRIVRGPEGAAHLEYDFTLRPGVKRIPQAPIP